MTTIDLERFEVDTGRFKRLVYLDRSAILRGDSTLQVYTVHGHPKTQRGEAVTVRTGTIVR